MTEKTELTSVIYVSAGRLKAIVDLMDSDITITSDGSKLTISSAVGSAFAGQLNPLDQAVSIPRGTWRSISLAHLRRLLALLPSDQLRREEMAVMIEAEGGKKAPPDVMEITISLTPGAVEFGLDFNQFEFDVVTLRLPAMYSESEEAPGPVARESKKKRLSRKPMKRNLPEPSHKLDTVEPGNQRDLKSAK